MVTTTTQLDAFVRAGNKERKYIAQVLTWLGATDIIYTDAEGYDTVDAYFTYRGTKCVLEAKVREMPLERFSGHYIEKKKADVLRHHYTQEGLVPFYLNVFEPTEELYDGFILYNLKNRFDLEVSQGYAVLCWTMMQGRVNKVAGGASKNKPMANLYRSRVEYGDLIVGKDWNRLPDPS